MSGHTPRGGRWDVFRRAMIRRSGGVCERCGIHGRLEMHHMTPLSDGGACYDPENVEVLCRRCHIEHHHPKSTNTDFERKRWLLSLQGALTVPGKTGA